MRFLVLLLSTLLVSITAWAGGVSLDVNNKSLSTQMKLLTKIYNKPVVVASGLSNKTINIKAEDVNADAAKHIIAKALSLEGVAVIETETEVSLVAAKEALKSGIETIYDTKFSTTPERFATLVLNVPKGKAFDMEKSIRALYSRDGAVAVSSAGDKLIISDWTSNLSRLQQVIQTLK
ncbi:MAG: hypothetical protein M9899_10240 [Bdellovibrionaceae bacterium]|nr:hypothetical protein [Pseudobdellovibrionaceae bacterium]